MAAVKPEVVFYHFYTILHISAFTHDTGAILASTHMFSWSANSTVLFAMLCDITGSEKSKMAAVKTGSSYISASTSHTGAILASTHMFSLSASSTVLFAMLRDITGSEKSKMAAVKTGNGFLTSGYIVQYCKSHH